MTLLELRDQINLELIRHPEKANLQMYYNTDYGIEGLYLGFEHGIFYRYKTKKSKYNDDTDYHGLIAVDDTDDKFWEDPNIEIIEEYLIC